MVPCKHCKSQNSLDSKFCKSCGLELSEEDRKIGLKKIEELVADGNMLFNQGRTEEAMMVAQSAVEANPNSTTGLSLLGMCYERGGDIAKALECYEHVLTINPDSALDRIKVTQLRNNLSAVLAADAKPNKARALAFAGGACILVLCIGGIIAAISSPRTALAANKPQTNGSATNSEVSVPFSPGAGLVQPLNQGGGQQQQQVNPANVEQGNGPTSLGAGNNGSSSSGNRYFPPLEKGPTGGTVLPGPTIGEGQIGPVNPKVETQNGPDAIITPEEHGNEPKVEEPAIKHEPDPPVHNDGIIEITPHGGNKGNHGTTQDIDSGGNQLQSLVRTAKQHLMLHEYDKAAGCYEKALRAGGDSGSINQHLGQCYQNLHRNAEAIAAFTKAAAAYKSSGQADAADACEQAIKTLRGN